MHSSNHEKLTAMMPEQREVVLDNPIELIERLCGRWPTGQVAHCAAHTRSTGASM